MPKMRSIIYRPDIYNLVTRILLFPDQKKLQKQVGGGWT